jgi:hypothetical protein
MISSTNKKIKIKIKIKLLWIIEDLYSGYIKETQVGCEYEKNRESDRLKYNKHCNYLSRRLKKLNEKLSRFFYKIIFIFNINILKLLKKLI